MRTFCVSILLVLCGCVQSSGQNRLPPHMTYSYSCLDSTVGGNKIMSSFESAEDIFRNLAGENESTITDKEQNDFGQKFHNTAVREGTFRLYQNEAVAAKLRSILQSLVRVRPNPSGIQYSIYALDQQAVNAFTVGGKIYITKGMLDRCHGRDALLYAIIGHEIGHNEKGHLRKNLADLRVSEKLFGASGQLLLGVKQMMTASFNQKNELEADYYGINLAYLLGHDVCSIVRFWNGLAREEGHYTPAEDFFRSHPFSSQRARCLQNHIAYNFKQSCTN